jgi:LacI family transcriptional regulator
VKVTIKDISREAGVSIATVSRALNNKPRTSSKTRAKILSVAERLGYQPNAAARTLSRDKTDAIGVVFHQMTSGFYASVMTGIDLEAYTQGYHVLVTISKGSDPGHDAAQALARAMRVDGLIILDATFNDSALARLKESGRPIVVIQRALKDPQVSSVAPDNIGGARAAVRHLLSLGYRDLLLIAGPPAAEDSSLRMEGCRQALGEAGIDPRRVPCILGHYSSAEALKAFRAYCASQTLPRAVFAFNDDMALAVMKELRITGVKVPQQVAVVGFDDIDAADYMGLTTVRVPMIEMGQEAVRLLAARMADPSAPAKHVLKDATLVIRESCGGE